MNNIKIANWWIKVWQISSICQIRQTKVLPNFHLLRYYGTEGEEEYGVL